MLGYQRCHPREIACDTRSSAAALHSLEMFEQTRVFFAICHTSLEFASTAHAHVEKKERRMAGFLWVTRSSVNKCDVVLDRGQCPF
jgi:hypothetical protein